MLKQTEVVMARVVDVLVEIGDKDCYDKISESSSGKPRKLNKHDYKEEYEVPVLDLRCMVTGVSSTSTEDETPLSGQTNERVVLAHLLPRSADAKTMTSLGYARDDIENIRNTVLLCKGIEEAFDRKQISFVPCDNPFSNNKYKLCIWTDDVKLLPIYKGATKTIGSYEGHALNLSVGAAMHNPFKRAMSFQAFRAFKMWGKDSGMTELPVDSDLSVYKGTYKAKRADYAKELARAIAKDADEDNDADV